MDSEVFEKLSPTKLFFRCAVPSMITMAFSALSVFLHILANGSSEFFSNISMSVMSVVYNFFLLKHGGTTALAALSDHIFFGTLVFPIGFLFILTPIWQLDGVWLSAFFSCTASVVVTIVLALTMKIKKEKI